MSTFQILAAVNISGQIDQKGGFPYLSWPFAVAELQKQFPGSTWEVKTDVAGFPAFFAPNGEAMVAVTVSVDGVSHTQYHPVLDHRNKPVQNPSVFDINTSIMRCLVKAIALHGLGLYIYAGEDLPMEQPIDEDMIQQYRDLLEAKDALGFLAFLTDLTDQQKVDLFNSFPRGEKTTMKAAARELETQGHSVIAEYMDMISEAIEIEDDLAIRQAWDELGTHEKQGIVWRAIPVDKRDPVKESLARTK